jgi:hypothetical protein
LSAYTGVQFGHRSGGQITAIGPNACNFGGGKPLERRSTLGNHRPNVIQHCRDGWIVQILGWHEPPIEFAFNCNRSRQPPEDG